MSIAGCLSSICEVFLTHPIDYIKTQKQNNNVMMREINPFNLYKGIYPRLVGVIPMRTVFWESQKIIKNYLHKPCWYNFILIGTGSAFFQSIIDAPLEKYKINKMIQHKSLNNTTYGFYPTLIRNVIFTNGLMFMCNEGNNCIKSDFLNSLVGGMVGSIISQPFDFIKTIKQSPADIYYNKYNLSKMNYIQIIKFFIKRDLKMLFKGGLYRLILSGSTMSIGYTSFNYFDKNINNLQK